MAGEQENRAVQEELARAEALLASGETITLKVRATNRGGLLVSLGELAGFIPNSSIPAFRKSRDRRRLADHKKQMIGAELVLKVIEIDENRPSVIFSPVEEDEAGAAPVAAPYVEGETVEGSVKEVTDEGVVLKLPNGSGFIPKEELAWRWLEHPGDFVKAGQKLECVVKGHDGDPPTLLLSRKELVPSPWKVFGRFHKAGDLVTARVLQIRKDGLFVQLFAGIHGLLHRRDINTGQAGRLNKILSAGDEIVVRIAGLDAKKEMLRLKMWWTPK